MKLNIGCGWDKKPGFVNIDKAKEVKPDMVVDIENGLGMFEADTFDYIYSSHCLEHIRPGKWDLVLNEIMRVIKNDGILELVLPFDNIKKRTNIGHYRTFSWWSFDQYLLGEKKRRYYASWNLVPLNDNKPVLLPMSNNASIFEIAFFTMFPILKKEIHFKWRVIK